MDRKEEEERGGITKTKDTGVMTEAVIFVFLLYFFLNGTAKGGAGGDTSSTEAWQRRTEGSVLRLLRL